MHTDSRRWDRRTTHDQRTVLEDQVVLGHLLPHYQAAQEWQDTVRAQRFLQRVGSAQQGKPAVVSLLRDAIRRWRSRLGVGVSRRGSVGEHVAVMTDRLSSAETLASQRPARVALEP